MLGLEPNQNPYKLGDVDRCDRRFSFTKTTNYRSKPQNSRDRQSTNAQFQLHSLRIKHHASIQRKHCSVDARSLESARLATVPTGTKEPVARRTKRCTPAAKWGLLKWSITRRGARCYTQVLVTPGPNVSQQVAIICIACSPSHTVCGPGGLAFFRFT